MPPFRLRDLAKALPALTTSLEDEERRERLADRAYWQPLKLELERLRHR